jgi:hypothetical protein
MDWPAIREHARVGVTLAIVTWLAVEVIAHFSAE